VRFILSRGPAPAELAAAPTRCGTFASPSGAMAAQPICNRQVSGFESPLGLHAAVRVLAGVGEWLIPADCKSAASRLRRFESCPLHHQIDSIEDDHKECAEPGQNKQRLLRSRWGHWPSARRTGTLCGRHAPGSRGPHSSVVERVLGKNEVMSSTLIAGSIRPLGGPQES
jgi:hypothetical protein